MAVAHMEKLELSGVQSRLARLAPADARLEITSLPGGITLLNDSKKGSFESFNGALDAFAQIPATRKIVILGKVEEPVGKVRDLYRNLGERLAGIANLIVCIGDDDLTSVRAGAVKAGLPPAAVHLHGSRVTGAAEFVREKLQPGDLVLVKGASAQKLQRVVLGLLGRDVSCHAKFCDAKVVSCNVCPLLNAPAKVFENCFISRYLKV
jgi:UDP-N-acetylmuramoyl-tripeptide--D-alanyl-D-alanine ligase